MDKLIVKDIIVRDNHVEYIYEKYGKWNELLTDINFFSEYDVNITNVPKSILIIPFLCNILPISYVFNLEIVVEEIDQEFFYSIEKIRNGYQTMFPSIPMGGTIEAESKIKNNYGTSNSATLFSGGIDAFNTLFQNINENPTLLTVWGADIKLEDEEGWNKVKKYNIQTANDLKLDYSFVKSNFKTFLNYEELSKFVSKFVNDEWWHGFQHGIGLLGLMAPISYVKGFNKVYIASSFTEEYWGKYTCASDPKIDNNLKYGNTITIHDGYKFNRQDKIYNICKYKKENNLKSIPIRVCWESEGGDNCCKCEKCTRTILGIIAEKENPNEYGFKVNNEIKSNIESNIIKYAKYSSSRYKCVQDRLIKNFSIEETPLYLIKFRNLKIHKNKTIFIKLFEKFMKILSRIKNCFRRKR